MTALLNDRSAALAPPPPVIAGIPVQAWQWRNYRISWLVAGPETGPNVVLLHGFGASIGHWRKNFPALAAAGYRVWVLDLLGFGSSQKPPIAYSLELWQDLVLDFWQEKIAQETVWIGNSIGALLAMMLAVAKPEATRGLVLLNAAGGLNHRPEELSWPLRQVMGAFGRLVSLPGVGRFLFDRIRQKHRIRGTLRQVYRNPAAITPELVDLLHDPSGDMGAYETFASILNAPPGPRPEDLLGAIAVPMLVLWGAEDPWTPISGASPYRSLATTDPQRVEFIPLPRTGHCPHDERPEVVNPLVVAWLDRKFHSCR